MNRKKKEKNMQNSKEPIDIIDLTAIMENEAYSTDVLGSYTGTPVDGDIPVQDADDL